jgi:uncharacterized membrane protein
MDRNRKEDYTIQRIGALLHKITPIVDSAGRVVHYITHPLMVELRRRDVMQIIVGASVLAIPVGFTEEAWALGERLPALNILGLGLISILFIAAFVYYNFYRELFGQYWFEYVKRVLAIYLLSLLVVGTLLTVIDVAPWATDLPTAIKRVVIVAFPASMSAAVSDAIK